MKKTIIITAIVVAAAFLALFVFNKITSARSQAGLFAEALHGRN